MRWYYGISRLQYLWFLVVKLFVGTTTLSTSCFAGLYWIDAVIRGSNDLQEPSNHLRVVFYATGRCVVDFCENRPVKRM